MTPTHITLTFETANKLLAYLNTRPHGEVRELIDLIVAEANKPAQPETPIPEGGSDAG